MAVNRITDYFHLKSNDPGRAESEESVEERKKKAIQKLEQKALYRLEYDHVGPSWMAAVFGPELEKEYFKQLKSFLIKEQQTFKVFPPDDLIYSWTRHCDFDSVKVVIIGQDPYHNDGQAMGLAFSVPKGCKPLPPSLLNIFKELASDVAGFQPPGHGDLSGWARQGVLLLNASLTVRAHQAASHSGKGWEELTDAVIKALSYKTRHPLVFMLWGAHALRKGACIQTKDRHLVLQAAHPSPLSASRGFFGCHHFSQCNVFLQANGMEPIDWNAL